MKQVFVLVLMVLGVTIVSGQDFTGLSKVELKELKQYIQVEEQVLDCCYYLTGTPFEKKDENRQLATVFVNRWVQGMPQIAFELTESINLITEGKEELVSIYKVSLAMAVIENKKLDPAGVEVERIAINAMLDYCSNPVNGVKMPKEMKRVCQVRQEGNLEAWLMP